MMGVFKGFLLSISLLTNQLSPVAAVPGVLMITTTTTETTSVPKTLTTTTTQTISTKVAAKPTACNKLPYDLFLPLSNFSPAKVFCSAKFPGSYGETFYDCPSTQTKTTSVRTTFTTTITEDYVKRGVTVVPTTTCNAQCKLLSSLSAQANGIVSTICACIEPAATTTITVSA